MAGRTNGTPTPRRISELFDSGIRGILGRDRGASADLRPIVIYGMQGKGFVQAQDIGDPDGPIYVVANGLGDATLQPGTIGVAASYSGAQGEVLLSKPPAGLGGAGQFGRTPSQGSYPRPDLPPSDAPVSDFIAFFGGIGDATASLYGEGSWFSDLDETTELLMSVGSWAQFFGNRFLLVSNGSNIQVWDVAGHTVQTYAPVAGRVAAPAHMVGSKVYWVEYQDQWSSWTSISFYLMSADIDLTNVAEMATHTSTTVFEWEAGEVRTARFTDSSVVVSYHGLDHVNGEIVTDFRVRFSLDGEEHADDLSGFPEDGGNSWDGLGVAAGSISLQEDIVVRYAGPDIVSDFAAFWPPDGDFAMDSLSPSGSLWVSSARTKALLYGSSGGSGVAVMAAADSAPTSVLARFAVHDHPVAGQPVSFFAFE